MPLPTRDIGPGLYEHCTPKQLQIVKAVVSNGSARAAARALGLHKNVVQAALSAVRRKASEAPAAPRRVDAEVTVAEGPDGQEPIEALVARKRDRFARASAAEDFHKLVPVRVHQRGPVAICAVGDPHVDDDGCDIGRLEHDMRIIGRTEGMHALHVGDITNNWVGRLGRLYAHQSTTASDGIRLAEWMFSLAPPLAVIGGNHDLWNEGMSWLSFVLRQSGTKLVQAHGVRLNLTFPSGQAVRIHARHNFPGHSQFNPVHGLRKEHLWGFRDHVNIAGHLHTDSYSVVPSPDGFMQHMLRVSGYKVLDDYAKTLNLPVMRMAPTCALVIDPDTKHPAELIKPFWDLDEAADYLTFKRRRAAA